MLLVSIDTLRADRLGCYGYGRDTSPALDRFAAERAVRFANAVAESSWTIPSHVTLLSGLHPRSHGVTRPGLAPASDVPLLAERLAEAGYYTFAVTGGGWLAEEQGFARGFASFHATEEPFARALETARDYVRHRARRGPWFAFLHTYDVHCPYDPPEPWFSMFESPEAEALEVAGRCGNPDFNELGLSAAQERYLADRYDGGVRRTDDALGAFLAFLADEGLLSNTVVVITSDHGEELGEHGRIGHEETVFAEALRVPLLVAGPGVHPGVSHDPVGLTDVVPSVLELLGLAPAPELDGVSFAPRLFEPGLVEAGSGAAPFAGDGRYSSLSWKAELDSWLSPTEHLIVDRTTGTHAYYRLDVDPGATRDVAGAHPERAAELRAELDRRRAELAGRECAPVPAAVSPAQLDALRRLGYAGGD